MSEIDIKSIDGLVNSNKSMRAETDVWTLSSFHQKPTIVLLNWRQTMKICVISQKFDLCHAAKYSVIDSTAENVLWEKENQRKDRGRGQNASRVVTDNTTLSKPIFTRPKNPWQSWEYQ